MPTVPVQVGSRLRTSTFQAKVHRTLHRPDHPRAAAPPQSDNLETSLAKILRGLVDSVVRHKWGLWLLGHRWQCRKSQERWDDRCANYHWGSPPGLVATHRDSERRGRASSRPATVLGVAAIASRCLLAAMPALRHVPGSPLITMDYFSMGLEKAKETAVFHSPAGTIELKDLPLR